MADVHDAVRAEREERQALAARLDRMERERAAPPPTPAVREQSGTEEQPPARASLLGPVLAGLAVLALAIVALIVARKRREAGR